MTVVRCMVLGTYLVRDETEPIPYGQTTASVSVVVHQYEWGWACTACRVTNCNHIQAAQEQEL